MASSFSLTDARTGIGFWIAELASGQAVARRTDLRPAPIDLHRSLADAGAFADAVIRAERLARGLA